MKNVLTPSILLLFSLLVCDTGFGQYAHKYVLSSSSAVVEEAAFRLIVTPAGGTLLDLSIEKLPDTPIEVRLRDEHRRVLLTHKSRTDAPLHVLRLDLKELDNGPYQLEVWVGRRYVSRPIRLLTISATEQLIRFD